jgi:hypothetical protein
LNSATNSSAITTQMARFRKFEFIRIPFDPPSSCRRRPMVVPNTCPARGRTALA